jgi:hypothetical protein
LNYTVKIMSFQKGNFDVFCLRSNAKCSQS